MTATTPPVSDPRTWVTLASVKELGFDPVHGFFADVVFIPSGEDETCLIGSAYAGDGYGLSAQPEVGDIVVVVVPHGDPGWGPVIVSRVWGKSRPPPIDAVNPTNPLEPSSDFLLKVKSGQALTIKTSSADISLSTDGSGNVSIEATGTGSISIKALGAGDVTIETLGLGKVKLGAADTALPVAIASLVEAAVAAAITAASTGHTHQVPALGTSGPGVLTAPVTVATTAATKTEAT